VAKQWRNVWGWTCFWMPARLAASLQALRGVFVSMGRSLLLPTLPGITMRWIFSANGASVHAAPQAVLAEHHIAISASLATLNVNHHALAVDVSDFQVCQFGVAHIRWRRASSAECDGRE